jgi:hypothetical protein
MYQQAVKNGMLKERKFNIVYVDKENRKRWKVVQPAH